MNPRALRLLRAIVVTATAVVVSSVAHIAGGGAAPGVIGLVTALVLGTVLGTFLLVGRRLTLARTAATIAAGQIVFHAVFGWGTGATASAVSGPSLPAHVHGAAGGVSADALPAHDAHGMLLAHVVAGVLSLAVLLIEQHLLDRMVVAARRAAARLLPRDDAPPTVGSVPRLLIGAHETAPLSRVPSGRVRRRGPPGLIPAV